MVKKQVEFHTDLWGMILVYDPDRPDKIGFRFRTPQGKVTNSWVDLPASVAKKFVKLAQAEADNKEEESRMTQDQLREKYQEYMGS